MVLLLPAGVVSAAQPVVPEGLTIAPVRAELTISPGTVQTGQLTIYNTTNSSLSVAMSAESFSVTNPQYDYAFDPTSNIIRWVQFDQNNVMLLPGKSMLITYSIAVPLGASPGGEYISLFATTTIDQSGQGLSSSERVGSLLYITVSGDATHSGRLQSLLTPWITAGSSSWTATIQNTGTAHFTSDYDMRVETLWNSPVSSSSGSSLILPGTMRLISGSIAQPNIPGIYKLVFSAGLGDSPSARLEHYIIYMPLYAWCIFVLVLAFIMTRVIQIVKRKRNAAK